MSNISIKDAAEQIAICCKSQSSTDQLLNLVFTVIGSDQQELLRIINRLTLSRDKIVENKKAENIQKLKEMARSLNVDVTELLPKNKQDVLKKTALEKVKPVVISSANKDGIAPDVAEGLIKVSKEREIPMAVYKYLPVGEKSQVWELRAVKTRQSKGASILLASERDGVKISDYKIKVGVEGFTSDAALAIRMNEKQYSDWVNDPTLENASRFEDA
jgi:hypothetical protein